MEALVMIYDVNGNQLVDASQNRLFGKKLTAIGDSFVGGTYENKETDMWWYKIAERNNMTPVNLGNGGESLRVMVQNSRYANIPTDSDYVVVFTGHNDVSYDHTDIGTSADTGNTTFYGCLAILCKWLMNNRPNAKILFITPTHRNDNADVVQYVNAMKEVCYRYGIPCWDAYGNLGMLIGGAEGVDQREIFETHNLRYHLNALGQTYLSYKIEAELARL
jgi:lysophospholipase L1-like esterase